MDKRTLTMADALKLAVEHHQAGRLQQAAHIYQQVLRANPTHAHANNLLGMIAHQAGNHREAVRLISKAIENDAGKAGYYVNLGLVYQALGEFDKALAAYDNALHLQPEFAAAHYNRGVSLQALGRFEDAVSAYDETLAIEPELARAHNNRGGALQSLGRLQAALAAYDAALRIKPDHAGAHNNRGTVLEKLGQFDAAISAYQAALRIDPGYAEAHNNRGVALQKNGRPGEALAAYQEALRLNPDYAEAHNNLGLVLEEDGRFEDALKAYREALRANPNYASAHRSLTMQKKFTEYSDEIRAMEALFDSSTTSNEDKIQLGFGLGKVWEDLEHFDKAFDYLAAANRLKRDTVQYDLSIDEHRVDRIALAFDERVIERYTGHGHRGDQTPIFIVGMPRSGTTLVEQILASHGEVFGAGELDDFRQVIFSRFDDAKDEFLKALSSLGKSGFKALGANYLNRVGPRARGERLITDKMPANTEFIGMIHFMLSDAKIVYCRRDPLDTCWSCFKNNFEGAQNFAYDLTELGRYHRLHDRLMNHWERVLPGRFLEVQYEELVVDQEAQTRRLLEHCGLEWDDACLAFHQTKRPVRTVSALQVRRPLYSSSVGRWKNYRRHLGPLIDALAGEC